MSNNNLKQRAIKQTSSSKRGTNIYVTMVPPHVPETHAYSTGNPIHQSIPHHGLTVIGAVTVIITDINFVFSISMNLTSVCICQFLILHHFKGCRCGFSWLEVGRERMVEAGSRDEKWTVVGVMWKQQGRLARLTCLKIFSKMKKMKERKNERNPCRLLP